MIPTNVAERITEIKTDVKKMRDFHSKDDYHNGDEILYEIERKHLDWLIKTVESQESQFNSFYDQVLTIINTSDYPSEMLRKIDDYFKKGKGK